MNISRISLSATIAAFLVSSNSAFSSDLFTSELETYSQQYSQEQIDKHPELRIILDRLGLEYLHELDPSKVYTLNKTTQKVSIASRESVAVKEPSKSDEISTASVLDFGFGSNVATIGAGGSTIDGMARTVITCPFSAQTANVSGFMASNVSRDPMGAGIREGTLYADDFISTGSEVTFSILKASGGARNPVNRTAMETTHTGTCGDDFRVANLVSTWPPLRVELAIDDTGSMSNELSGLKIALSNFIDSQSTPTTSQLRESYYELITFKDSPSLRMATTSDAELAKSAVQGLSASGGGDCPEDSLGALDLALSRVLNDENTAAEIVLVTDASPQAGNISGLIATAQSLNVPVNVLLSGDCVSTASTSISSESVSVLASTESAREVFKRIAEETGGEYIYEPDGSANDYANILEDIFDSALKGDSQPPEVDVTVTPDMLWPPNHKMVQVGVNVSAFDNIDPAPVVQLVGVTVNEPENGQGDGNTFSDYEIGEDGSIYLRAERSGEGTGRIYTITFKATDSSGNEGFGSADVLVPHNK